MTKGLIELRLYEARDEEAAAMQKLDLERQELHSKIDYFNNYFNSRIKYESLEIIAMIFTYAIHFFAFTVFLIYFPQFISHNNTTTEIIIFVISSILFVLALPLLVAKLIISISDISFKNKKIPNSIYTKRFVDDLYWRSTENSDIDGTICAWIAALDIVIVIIVAIVIKNGVILWHLLTAIALSNAMRVIPPILEKTKYQNEHFQFYLFKNNFENFNQKSATIKKSLADKIKNLESELRRKTAAESAEEEYNKLINSGVEDIYKIRLCADEGSPSACGYMGKRLYSQFINEILTIKEKEELAKRIISYLKKASTLNSVEYEFILLSVWVKTESNPREVWEEYLQKARRIKNSNKLPQEYSEEIDYLINTLVKTLNRFDNQPVYNNLTYTNNEIDYKAIQRRNEKSNNIKGDSMWRDYRTGERLKETYDGKIVDSNGNEVCASWWD